VLAYIPFETAGNIFHGVLISFKRNVKKVFTFCGKLDIIKEKMEGALE
jgi:hypothetical protein